MLRNKRFISSIMSFLLVLGLVIMPSMSFAQEETLSLTIVHVNDIHGRVNDLEDTTIGYARLKSIVDSLKADDPNLLLLDAGDTFHGTNFANFSEGDTILNLMNSIGFHAMTPGNHDFNYGSPRLLELAELADFPILGANIVDEEGGDNVLQSYEIISMENGLEIGIFGISTEETKVKSHPNNTIGIEIIDPIAVAEEMVAELEDEGVDFIIALSHIGVDEESDPTTIDIAEAVEGIDLIVDGHSHSTLAEGQVVDGTLIVQTGSHMANIGLVEIEISGVEVDKKARLINYEESLSYEPDEEVAAYIKEVDDANEEILSEVIGSTEVLLDGVRDNVRTKETNLGNLITDAMLDLTDADVALTNGGGIRESIPEGDITMNHILTVLPFANYPVVIEVTGEDIVDALEFGTSDYPASAGKFPHVAGMTYEINVLAPPGHRVQNVLIGGEAVDLDAKYKLMTNDFMGAGGDGYTMFEGASLVEGFDHLLLSDVLIAYIQGLDEVNPKVEGRISPVEESVLNRENKLAYIKGYGNNTVRPSGLMTREAAASVITRIFTDEFKDKVTSTEHKFTDVAKDRWSNDAIATLAKANVINGYGDNIFKPGGYITRAEVAKMISQFYNNPIPDEQVFTDTEGHWADGYIHIVAHNGLVEGYGDASFKPNKHISRAEFIAIINRALDREIDLNNLPEDLVTFPDLNESSWYYEDVLAAINNL